MRLADQETVSFGENCTGQEHVAPETLQRMAERNELRVLFVDFLNSL